MMAGDYVQYSCTSDEADPAPLLEVSVTDQKGDDVSVNLETKVNTVEDVGYRVVFGVSFEDHIPTAEIECKAKNEIGQAMSRMTIHIQCKFSFWKCEF